jgi:diguanylate cyclase (GGDEF)-like protein
LQNARIVLVVLCLLVFGTLNLVQNSIIERQSRQQSIRRKEAEEHIRSLSLEDPLTRLLNRRAFDAEFARAVARARRSRTVLGLMFIDLDQFKTVNDTFGHSAGDSVLREGAARIKSFTREVDTLARYGGDEFVLVFEALENQAAAETVGRRILDGFKMGFQFESGRIELSASIGIAIFPGHGRTPSELFEAADRAMYRVKQSGGSGVELA